jgi:hypothetical protein
MEDSQTIEVEGKFIGINKNHGVGKNHARIFIRRDNGSIVDGLVLIDVYKKLERGNKYKLTLTKANDPYLSRRIWV